MLGPGGRLLAGFMSPALYLFDHEESTGPGTRIARHRLPCSVPAGLTGNAPVRWHAGGHAAEFAHSLQGQIGGQLAAGFRLPVATKTTGTIRSRRATA